MTRAELIAAMDLCVGASRLISELPSVATLDWADRAAASLAVLAEDALSVVFVGSLGDLDAVVDVETIGVAWGGATGRLRRACRVIESRPSEVPARDSGSDVRMGQSATRVRSRQEIESTELTLRSRLERLTRLGVRFEQSELFPGVVTVLEMTGGANAVYAAGESAARSAGELALQTVWRGVGVSRAAIGLMGLSDKLPNRVIAAMVGFPTDDAPQNVLPNMRDAVVTSALRVLLPELGAKAATAIGTTPATSSRWLTAREQQVLRYLSFGMSVREIADELGRSPHTVHDHVKSLHRKLGASSRGELVARALGFSGESEPALDQVELPTLLGSEAIESDEQPLVEVATRPAAISSSTLGRAVLPQRSEGSDGTEAGARRREDGDAGDRPEINVSVGRASADAAPPVQRGDTRAKPLRPHG
ncbi:MAG: LuxR C-terminal-related transcriptional regulator [Planctomycetota bacterium]